MPNYKYKNRDWINYLIYIGEFIKLLSAKDKTQNITIALCLPRIDYATAFVGLGILKASNIKSEANIADAINDAPLHHWVGKWVAFQKNDGQDIIGILEYCSDRNEFKLRHYKRKIPNLANMTLEERAAYRPPSSGGLWDILQKSDWSRVTPIGREFNEGRRVGSHQINRVINTNKSIANISKFFDYDFSSLNISPNNSIFEIIGNKSRIAREIFESLFIDEEANLREILKPKESNEDTKAHRCEIKSNKIGLNSNRKSILLIESSNLLSDHLTQSKHSNKVILLGRNMPNYHEFANLIQQQYSISNQDVRINTFDGPEIHSLAFRTK